jgi:hypothetical protein
LERWLGEPKAKDKPSYLPAATQDVYRNRTVDQTEREDTGPQRSAEARSAMTAANELKS